tara:strand:- start:2279 stop:3211 length:933 start_codon:yes stop_codon:yes gene_type:complete
MRHIFSLLAIALIFSSCEDDEPVVSNNYPTENISLTAETNSLVILEYSSTSSTSANSELIRGDLADMFSSNVVHLSLASNVADPMYVANGDSISDHFGGKPAGTFLLNGSAKTAPEILSSIDEINDNKYTKPILSVGHVMTTNDTAWIADILVEFFKDTLTPFLYIESYLVADVEAINYNGTNPVDLRLKPDSPLVTNQGETTKWAKDFYNSDTTKLLYPINSTYMHKGVFLGNFNSENSFGTQLASYTKFGGEYFKGDNIGLKQNPIQHYFLKSDYDHLDFSFQARIVTVVWAYDFIDLDYKYVNSYSN